MTSSAITILRKLILLLVTTLASVGGTPSGVTILSDVQVGAVRGRTLIGSEGDEEFVKMAKSTLESSDITLGVISLYASRKDILISGWRDLDHCGYHEWRSLLNTYHVDPKCPGVEVKQAVKIGKNIVLRTANRKCHVEERVIQGSRTPLHQTINGHTIDITNMSVAKRRSPYGPGARAAISLQGRCEHGRSIELAKQLLREIEALADVDVEVVLRDDGWFLDDCGSPAVSPFQYFSKAPDWETYRTTTSTACIHNAPDAVVCFESNARR